MGCRKSEVRSEKCEVRSKEMISVIQLILMLMMADAEMVSASAPYQANVLYVAEVQPEGWGLTFAFVCATNRTYTLQATTDLAVWEDVCYVRNVEGVNRVGYLSDFYWRLYPARFYRLQVTVGQ